MQSHDKDCIEDLRVYLTRESQAVLDQATSARTRCVELLHVDLDVDCVPYNSGYYTVNLTFYYKVIADVTLGGIRPTTIYGLAVFEKRVLLFGGEGNAKIFTNRGGGCCATKQSICNCNKPKAVVEVVDPMVLSAKVQDICNCCHCDCDLAGIPECILSCFDSDLVLSGEAKRLLITIGQFSIIRLERETQLLIPSFDYCIPTKECPDVGGISAEDACDVFAQVDFPVNAFFPAKNDPCISPIDSCSGCYRTTTA